MTHKKTIFLEIILIIASVFIFKSIWTLLDKIPIMNNIYILWISLAISIIITILTMNYMLTKLKNK